MRVKVFTASTEIEASIIRGALRNVEIEAWIGPGEGSLSLQARSRGPNVPHDIFVEDKDVTQALEVLKEIQSDTV